MNLEELHFKLRSAGIPLKNYYLHGLYGSTDDRNRLAMAIRKGKYYLEYEVYYRGEKGSKNTVQVFTEESKACDFFFKKVKDDWIFEKIQKIEGLGGMTVNERLAKSGLLEEFDHCRKNDKTRAVRILRWLKVDEKSIAAILK